LSIARLSVANAVGYVRFQIPGFEMLGVAAFRDPSPFDRPAPVFATIRALHIGLRIDH
jgi:hypothetical protein